MKRYLLFDSGCCQCSKIAKAIEQEAGGKLTIRSLRDPAVKELLDRERPGWKWEPMLVEEKDDKVRIYAGGAMSRRLLVVLGPRRALRIVSLLRDLLPEAKSKKSATISGASRRDFLKKGIFLAGLALTGIPSKSLAFSPSHPPQRGHEGVTNLGQAEIERLKETLKKRGDVRKLVSKLGLPDSLDANVRGYRIEGDLFTIEGLILPLQGAHYLIAGTTLFKSTGEITPFSMAVLSDERVYVLKGNSVKQVTSDDMDLRFVRGLRGQISTPKETSAPLPTSCWDECSGPCGAAVIASAACAGCVAVCGTATAGFGCGACIGVCTTAAIYDWQCWDCENKHC